jgi:3',5'-cyclic AMP phosphodiesterase CpdA
MAELRATILHLSDLHFGRPFDPALWAVLMQVLPPLHPDAIVVTGDLADNPRPYQFRKAANHLRKLQGSCEEAARHTCHRCQPVKAANAGDANLTVATAATAPAEVSVFNHSHRPLLLAIPGNHDYRILGNVGLGWLSRFLFDFYFADPNFTASDAGMWRRLRRYSGLAGEKLKRKLLHLFSARAEASIPYELKSVPLANGAAVFFLYDSNRVKAFAGLATGRVHPIQIAETEPTMQRLLREGFSARAYRIALVHHHPLPIPYADSQSLTNQEGFLVLNNAGTFMRQMTNSDFDLILHGHKHYSNFTRVSYQLNESDRAEIGVIAAGTGTIRDGNAEKQNSYNVIRIYENERASVEQLEFNISRAPHFAQHAPFPFDVYSVKGLKDRAYRRNVDQQKFSVHSLAVVFQVSSEGDVRVTQKLKGLAVHKDRRKTNFPVGLSTTTGLIRGPRLEGDGRGVQFTWKPDESAPATPGSMEHVLRDLQQITGAVDFGQPLQAEMPVNFEFSHTLVNSLARDDREYRLLNHVREPAAYDANAQGAPTDGVDFGVPYPIQHLTLKLELPTEFQSEPFVQTGYIQSWMDAAVGDEGNLNVDGNGNIVADPDMKRFDEKNLHRVGRGSDWRFDVERPPVGYVYSLKWRLPPAPTTNVPDKIVEEAKAYRRLLVEYGRYRRSGPRTGGPESEIQDLFRQCYEYLRSEFTSPDFDERFNFSMMTIDATDGKLVSVDGWLNGAPPDEAFWNFWLYPGLGNAGASLKRGTSLVYWRKQASASEYDYYVPWGNDFGVLVSIPVSHPDLGKHVKKPPYQVEAELAQQIIAIVNIGSSSTASGLSMLKDRVNEAQLKSVAYISQELIYAMLKLVPGVLLTSSKSQSIVEPTEKKDGEKR